MFVVEGVDKTFQITGALLGSNQRAEIPFDCVIRQFLGVLVGRTQSGGSKVDCLVRKNGMGGLAPAPSFPHWYKRVEVYRWPFVVPFAIGKREASNAFWIE